MLVAVSLALGLAACDQGTPQSPPLAGAPIGGALALVDQDGRRVSNDTLKGRYRLMYFGYSFCPDVCPVDVQRLAQGLTRFEARDAARAAKVQPVFVTIDPARDTSAALKTFVAAFHPRLIGLTGSAAAIDGAKRAFRVYAARGEGTDDKNYLMDHSAFIYLMDPDGLPIMYFERGDSADAIAAGLDTWVH